ncbi:MAG TPA: PQQ-binding-like beta-propeller repeat protein [Verrucomicrobiae bacterium]|nr:PQQ-binding-like beta-propeller repeat protein [Verrucomicrobiae bacterium]
MNRRLCPFLLLPLLFPCAMRLHASNDWPCWRGPGQNGVAADIAAATGAIATNGVRPIWTSEPILSERDGGYGSPVVAGGKVYVYCCWRTKHPVEYRIVREENLADIGVRRPAALSDARHAEIEAARVSQERKDVGPDELDGWMERWSAQHLTPEERKAPGVAQYTLDRLRRGEGALPIETLETLASIIDKKFESEAALDAWAASSGIDPMLWRRQIRSKIPDYERTEEDVLFCLDAENGKTLWKYSQPSRSTRWSSSTTPCVAGGGVFFLGAQCTAYGLDAATGAERWKTPIAGPTVAGNGCNSSFAFADGKLFVMAGRLVALDAGTGKTLWECKEVTGFSSSPVIWRNAGKTFVICGESRRCAVDAATGKIAWRVPTPGQSTPAVSGDIMAIGHGHGLIAYRLSPQGAEKIAETDKGGSKGGSPIAAGNRIYSGTFEAACLDTTSGSLLWTAHRGLDGYSSGALANGRLWCLGKGNLLAIDPETGKELARTRVDFLKCGSPAFANGKIFVRTRKGITCYDPGAKPSNL